MTDEETTRQEPQQPEKEEAKAPDNALTRLRRELESLQKERDDLFGRLQRVSADYANFQKRVPKQVSDSVAYEKDKILRSLLPILDNLEHTLKAHSAESPDAVVRGVEIIYGQMLDILKMHGVEQMHALGEPFDPMRHEALMRKEDRAQPPDVVLEELQKGYMSNDHVLRPTRVAVNKTPASQPQNQEPEEESPEQEQNDK
ncbi:MAG: nucleotide exchange factor GrpE [Sedimentisphaerales bacterium]|nr:nucleotide exchange factor GrpE [Sedimentisphaerales bacterium]